MNEVRAVKKTVTWINSFFNHLRPVKVLDGYFLFLLSVNSNTNVAKAIISESASNTDMLTPF